MQTHCGTQSCKHAHASTPICEHAACSVVAHASHVHSDVHSNAVCLGLSANWSQVRDLQHRISVLEAQLLETDELRRRAGVGERSAAEWKEKWNYQVCERVCCTKFSRGHTDDGTGHGLSSVLTSIVFALMSCVNASLLQPN